MTWALARDQIVSIVEGTTPTTKRGGLQGFKHRPKSDAENLPQDRGFWIEYDSGHLQGPMFPTFPTWTRASVAIKIRYPQDSERERMQDIIMQDYLAIAPRVGDPANWNRPSSGIVALNIGNDTMLPFNLTYTDGAIILSINFTLDFKVVAQGGGF